MALQPCRTSLAHGARSGCLRAAASSPSLSLARTFTADAAPTTTTKKPRWSQTPEGMKAPLRMDWAKNPRNKVWVVNNNPERLDEVYDRLLGPGGRKMLPEELKWLAVTHKSFDQGRRGFNDKLALMGRLTLILETTKHIVSKSPLNGTRIHDEYGREPSSHPQLQSVENLLVETPQDLVGKEALHVLARKVGLLNVMRWKPRLPEKLESSGVEAVLNGGIMAIIGAITLQHGAAVAAEVVRERILSQVSELNTLGELKGEPKTEPKKE